MSLNKFMERWQALDASLKLDPQSNDLTANCRTRLRRFKIGLLLSDILEIGACLAMACVWAFPFTRLFSGHKPLMYVGAASILFVGAFLAGARALRRRNAGPAFGSVANELPRQLYAINQRIWLLRNVVWWYLAPLAFAILTVLIAARGEAKGAALEKVLLIEPPYGVCCVVFFIAVYFLNQRVVRKTLLPLKDDLQKILQDLKS